LIEVIIIESHNRNRICTRNFALKTMYYQNDSKLGNEKIPSRINIA